jgi:spermidine/putrescine ABC transporter ATP-binding subunit
MKGTAPEPAGGSTVRPVVALEAVSKRYGPTLALDAVSLVVRDGEFLSLLGPSGCGKTTTLNVVAGFVSPDAGRIRLDDEDVTYLPPWQRGLGVVFQSYALFPHMTVAENVAFGLRERGVPRGEIDTRVKEALALVRLPAASALRPAQLSGGMQQRVALARALVIRPRVLLLDEPLAALDRKLREEMRAELREIQRAVGITTVFVTHDQDEALGLSDRVAVMNAGRIEQLGSPRDVYDQPATPFVADFIGASSALEGRVLDGHTVALAGGRTLEVRLAQPLRPGAEVRLLVRPERLELGGSGPNALPARVTSAMFLGDRSEVRLELEGGQRVVAIAPGGARLAAGDHVSVTLPPEAFLAVREGPPR